MGGEDMLLDCWLIGGKDAWSNCDEVAEATTYNQRDWVIDGLEQTRYCLWCVASGRDPGWVLQVWWQVCWTPILDGTC
jgi:hypothetical protein